MRIAPILKRFVASAALAAISATTALANPTILFDLDSGRIYSHQDAFKRWYPASLTKLMTAYVAYRAIQNGELTLQSPIRVTRLAAAQPPSKMGYKVGSVMTLDNALKMMLVKSANDIAMAIGENVGGDEAKFAERMNAEARRLGMTGTHYANPNGLFNAEQYTTARDQAILVQALRKEFPQYDGYYAIEALQAGKAQIRNFNLLIGRFDGATGMKTGFVCESGFNQIATANRNGRNLAAITLGNESAVKRAEHAAAMLDQGFVSQPGADTVATLAHYDVGAETPGNMREQICPKPVKGAAPNKAPSEVGEAPPPEVKSLYQLPIAHPLKVSVIGLGGATGPVPLARRTSSGEEISDVPIPAWRPDRPAPTGLEARIEGDGGLTERLRK